MQIFYLFLGIAFLLLLSYDFPIMRLSVKKAGLGKVKREVGGSRCVQGGIGESVKPHWVVGSCD